jgi:ATP-dependent Clp protease ATP-binding subunit ClpC
LIRGKIPSKLLNKKLNRTDLENIMESRFSPRVKDVLTYSREEALRLGHEYVGTEHLLLGIIREGEGLALQILDVMGVSPVALRKEIENTVKPGNRSSMNLGNIPLVKQAEKVLKVTVLEAKLFNSPIIETEHLLLAILKDEDSVGSRILKRFDVDYRGVREKI